MSRTRNNATFTVVGNAVPTTVPASTKTGGDFVQEFLKLSFLNPTDADYKVNYFRDNKAGDRLFELLTGLTLEYVPASTVKFPLCTSGQTVRSFTASAAVQIGQLLKRDGATGQVAPATSPTADAIVGVAMHEAQINTPVWVCMSGIYFGQVDNAALPNQIVDCTSDGSSRLVAGVATNHVVARRISGTVYTVSTRNVSIFNFYNEMILA
jgi:hypothetical protein